MQHIITYICKKTDVGIELVMKGTDRQVQYAVASKYIFFIESNVNVYSGEIEQKNCPLYIIDMQNDKVYATEFLLDLKNPYFVGIQSLSNESILVTYCDSGIYNPMDIKHYIIDRETIEGKLSKLF